MLPTTVFSSHSSKNNNWKYQNGSQGMDFPGSSVVKNPPANSGDAGLIPGLGRSLGVGSGHSLQDSCLENSIDRGAWWATVYGATKLDVTEHQHAKAWQNYTKFPFPLSLSTGWPTACPESPGRGRCKGVELFKEHDEPWTRQMKFWQLSGHRGRGGEPVNHLLHRSDARGSTWLHVLPGRPAEVGVARILQSTGQNRLWAVQLLPIMTAKPKENCSQERARILSI